MQEMNIAQALATGVFATDDRAQKITDAIEKMLDTVSGSDERNEAKQKLIDAMLLGK